MQGPSSANGTGRVEVFYKGQWGTICDNGWDINDARVVCRQLGYNYTVRALDGARVPDGTGKIWINNMDCTSSDQDLTSCSHSGWGSHNCKHSKDAGVECSSTGKLIFRLYAHSRISLAMLKAPCFGNPFRK